MSRSMRTFNLFVVALALGITATWLANRWLQDRLTPAESAEVNTTPVVVAALEIPFGQKIEPAHLKTIQWPNETIPNGTFDDVAKVEGKIANQMITKGELVLHKRVVEEVNGSTLSAILTPGKRAVTVRVNDVIGVGGVLLPGNQTASTDQDKPVVVRAVTLEMEPKHAEKLVQATEEGSVQLALRNPLDESRVPVPAKSKPVKRTRSSSGWGSVTVIRGTAVDKSKVRL